ncbi:hypothetical protein D3C76_1773330 [compost metagenome]
MYIAAGITFFALLVSWWLAPETRALDLNDAASLDSNVNPLQSRSSGGQASTPVRSN